MFTKRSSGLCLFLIPVLLTSFLISAEPQGALAETKNACFDSSVPITLKRNESLTVHPFHSGF